MQITLAKTSESANATGHKPADQPAPHLAKRTTLVLGGRPDLVQDFIAHRSGGTADADSVVAYENDFGTCEDAEVSIAELIVFLPLRKSPRFESALDQCASQVARNSECRVCIVSSFRVHFDDRAARELEQDVYEKLVRVTDRVTVLRPGHILSRESIIRRMAPWYPLVPRSITTTFLDVAELLHAMDVATITGLQSVSRRLTLLGSNRLLRDVMEESARPGLCGNLITLLAYVLSWLQIGRLAGWMLAATASVHKPLSQWRLRTLEPNSVGELLCLYNPLNRRHVALAGYNTGVNHFGWRYPRKTVVRTTSGGRLIRVRGNTVTVDAGILLKQAIAELNAHGKEFYVVPNYSYISMGTTFMVPVHGSGSEVSTLGDTIEQALVYDPDIDRILSLKRGDERFGRYIYNPGSGVLVLRLRLRIRDKARYFVKRAELDAPTAEDIWQVFADPDASNIEIRKSRAADSAVEVSRYYTTPSTDGDSLEVPRDSIGRLWDRLEENRVTSWLFHTYVRKCGFHVELFLDREEFEIFWQHHSTLPLSKIQLRLVRCDGLASSPFGDTDRISADIFMQRKQSATFLAFMKEHLPHARFNPGKHSM